MIPAPKLKLYRNGLLIAFFSNLIEVANEANIPALKTVLNDLQTVHANLNASYSIEKGSLMTEEIKILDKRRDMAIQGIKTVVKGYTYYFDVTVQDKARLILKIFTKHGSRIANFNYNSQTAIVKSIVSEFETNEYLQSAIDTFHLSLWIAELKTANESFGEKYLDRITNFAAKKGVSVTKQRPNAFATCQKFMKHLNANMTINPTPELTRLVATVTQLVKKYNQSLR
jgi:hypothetical protein